MLNAELRQRAADLGHGAFVHLPAGLGREEIMATAIGVEAARKAMGGEHFGKPAQARERPFLLHQKRRVDGPRRIVERDDQVQCLRATRNPAMTRAVLVQHHPRQRLALPLAPVRPAPRRLLQMAALLKIALGPGIAPAQAMVAHRLLVEMLGCEASIAHAVEFLDLLRLRQRHPLR